MLQFKQKIYVGIYPSSFTISIFEQRSSFQMFHFMTNDPEVVVKCRWGSGGAVSSAVSSRQSLGRGSGGKTPEKYGSFSICRANK